MAYFQRHLALAFLICPAELEEPLTSQKIPPLIHSIIDSSQNFEITKDTDYLALAARISLLDITIGPGLSTVPFRTPSNSISSHELPISVPDSSKEIEVFNREIDALAKRIRLLSNNIVELGAIEDLTRLDAKDCCERLYHRLENAVRIGGRKSTNVFDDSNQLGSKKVFRNWLNRQKTESRSDASAMDGDVEDTINEFVED